MIKKVRKRDGSIVPFQQDKIAEAIWKAVKAVGGTDRQRADIIAEIVSKEIEKRYPGGGIPEVEEIQDTVEKILIEEKHAKVAKAYILYRKSHEELRNVKGLFDTIEVIDDYIGLNDWMVKENSNMGFSLQGLNNYIATKIITNYWVRRIYPEAIRKAHEDVDLHIHDLGTLGAYCFDDKTLILTENGWKLFKDVKKGEKVATKNLETGELEFQIPYDKQIYNYSGKMYSFEGRNISLLVTPEHRLLVRRKGKKSWEFVNPSEFKYGMEFDKKLLWKGNSKKTFDIQKIAGGNRKKILPCFKIEDYVEFMGWYISEGSVYEPNKGDYRISIAQSEKKYRKEILELLKKMKIKHNDQSKENIHIHSKDLFYHLKDLGISKDKYIPKQIKELEPQLIKKFLIALFKGDGTLTSNGKLRRYYTKSKQLAEDVTECLLKIELCGTISKRKNSEMYSVSVENNHLTPVYRKKILKKDYKGKVYDFSVKNGTLVVMREGKIVVSGNCVGWDLKDLLLTGFKGVPGKIASKPPKHLRTALGQMVNFFYTLQGETAGAQAFSNFDTLLAPFVKYDNLDYPQVKQAMQEFLFNLAVPTRVGFQCMSEDTQILTPFGWKSHNELKEGDIIKTFNIKTNQIEEKPVKRLFAREYEGIMYNLKNRIQDQLISPKHRVVRKKFQSEEYSLEEIEKMKSPFIIPIAGENKSKEINLSDEKIKLIAWIIAEGSVENYSSHRHSNRITIYQSAIKNPEEYQEINSLLKNNGLIYYERDSTPALGSSVKMMRLNAESSRQVHSLFETQKKIHQIPLKLLNMSCRQSRLFLETYLKADGFENCKISTTSKKILEGLQQIAVNAEYGFTVLKRKPTIGTKPIYVLRLIKHKDTYINKIEKINYKGIIWCPNTENETVIAKRKGKVFITGNTPFTNITMDLKVPEYMKDEPVIIGGVPQKETYKEFQNEINIINKAFAECMIEGDANGRLFTFPIPTYNISKDFDWENPEYDLIWEMTSKYGIPYFSNFINSDMKPEDARSMCPLGGDEKVLIKSSRGRGLEYSNIREIYRGSSKQEKYEIYSKGKFVKGKFNKFENQKMIKVILENGHEIKMSENHLNFVNDNKKEKILIGKELRKGMYLPYSLEKYEGEGGNKELGYFVGAFAGDGSFDRETSVIFSLEDNFKKEIINKLQDISKKYFGANVVIKKDNKTKLVTLRVHSRAAVGLCKDFVEGKEREKHYKARLFGMGIEFREGVIEGHYATDGGNRNRIYTSSKKMIESLNMLAATLGTTTSIYEDKREGRLSKEPNYAVLFYKLNRENYGDILFKKDKKLWVKIKEILEIKGDVAYCFEVEKEEPIFTIGTTGVLTHNCRLRLDQKELRKRGGGLFGSNPLTGCYDEKTEILTKGGWKFFKNLTKKDEVFTLTDNNKIELNKPLKLFEYNHDGEMYNFKTKSFDLLVTPNHRMVVDTCKNKRKFVEAKDFDVNNHRIPKQADWVGEEKESFILPPIEFKKYGRQGRTPYNVIKDSLKVKMDTWLKFFGFWLAEGCTDNEKIAKDHGYRVIITQVNQQKRKEIKEVLDELPFNYYEEKYNFVICNKQLWSYLRQFGNKYEKFIPYEIKNLSKKQLKILFDWMVKGDGHIRKTNGQINYWTASKKLADDLQEVILKLGWLGTIIFQDRKISEIKGRPIKSHLIYCIGVQKAKHYRLRKNNIKKVYYNGKVYCCEVKNHTVFVRRNGKVTWCGNSIGVVTINLPRIGFTAVDEQDFLRKIERLMELAKESLEIKRKNIERFTELGLYPYSRFYLRNVKKRFNEYWKNHFGTIGILGMNEAIMNFMPGENIATPKGKDFSLRIMDFMRNKLEEFQTETGNIYNLEATPGEGTTYRFARGDKKRFGRIIVANEKSVRENNAKPYYTNSTQLPVNYTSDVFEALELQDDLQTKYTGGTVFHTYVGERIPKESVKLIVKKIAESFKLPYFTITPIFSICPIHGYLAGDHEYCPICEQEEDYPQEIEKIMEVKEDDKNKM